MIQKMLAAIFDLDGVIVDTAKYHYLAWKRLANSLGFDFSQAENEQLKGVSRLRSLEILLEIGQISVDPAEKDRLAAQKNAWYVEMIRQIDASEILPGALEYLHRLRARGIKTAIGSASKNTPLILERLGIAALFDAVVDGNQVSKAKPDPEVFLLAAQALGLAPDCCVVFEDAQAGIQAALAAGMGAVGIGQPADLPQADLVLGGLWQLLIIG
ncbi:MAG: beta-phosphoglucomutase [Anaerolineales bacterium]|jgi:beta-phosphoglucomutase|nr:beta-phosphoglucomutase [Anaerolineales bacterium]